MKTANIVSTMLNQSGATPSSKSSPVMSEENSFNAHFNREINSTGPAQHTAQNTARGTVQNNNSSNTGNKPSSNSTPSNAGASNATSSTVAKAKDKDAKDDDHSKQQESDSPLMILFGAMSAVPESLPTTATSDSTDNASASAATNLSLPSDTQTTIAANFAATISHTMMQSTHAEIANGTPGAAILAAQQTDGALQMAGLKPVKAIPVDTANKNTPLGESDKNFAATLADATKTDDSATTATAANLNAVQPGTNNKDLTDGLSVAVEGKLTPLQSKINAINTPVAPQAILPNAALQLQNMAQVAAGAGAVAGNQITQPFGSTGWDKAVGQKVLWMVSENMHSAELSLNPPDLGPLQVVLKVSNEHASASFMCSQPEVREALESSMPKLRQMMSDAGIQLSGFSVNTQSSGQGQAGSGYRPTGQDQVTSLRPLSTTNDTAPAPAAPTRVFTSKIGEVDTFA